MIKNKWFKKPSIRITSKRIKTLKLSPLTTSTLHKKKSDNSINKTIKSVRQAFSNKLFPNEFPKIDNDLKRNNIIFNCYNYNWFHSWEKNQEKSVLHVKKSLLKRHTKKLLSSFIKALSLNFQRPAKNHDILNTSHSFTSH